MVMAASRGRTKGQKLLSCPFGAFAHSSPFVGHYVNFLDYIDYLCIQLFANISRMAPMQNHSTSLEYSIKSNKYLVTLIFCFYPFASASTWILFSSLFLLLLILEAAIAHPRAEFESIFITYFLFICSIQDPHTSGCSCEIILIYIYTEIEK